MAKAPKEPKKPSSPERREMHTKLGLLTIAIMINLIGFSIVIPLLPEYIGRGLHIFGVPGWESDHRVATYNGLLLSSYAFMQFLFAPLWGRLSDKIGRKPVLLISLAGDVVFYALFALSQNSIEGQFASRLLAGVFSSGSLSVAQAYVADVTPPEERAVGLGMLGAAFGVGFVLGPAIGGLLGPINIGLPMFIASGLALVNALYIVKYLPESRTAALRTAATTAVIPVTVPQRLAAMGKALTGPLGFVYILTFLVTFAFANMEGTFTPYIQHMIGLPVGATHDQIVARDKGATRLSGYCFTYIGVLIVIVQGGLIRRLRTKFTEAQLVVVGVAMMALGFWLFALPTSLWILMLGPMVPIAVGSALNSPSLRALVSRLSSADVQGGTLGISASFDSLARALGPGFGGYLAGRHGLASPYYFAGGVMTIALVWAITQYKKLSIPLPGAVPVVETAQPS